MSALKPLDFQEATANRILELYQQKQYRVLLADEVGLGKTIIASAVIQKVADLHAAWDDHFKVFSIKIKDIRRHWSSPAGRWFPA